METDDSQFRLSLLSHGASKSSECNGRLEFQQGNESDSAADVNHSHRLMSSEKKSLIIKRLIPFVISLFVLGGAVTIRFLIPLPSSHDVAAVGNDSINLNSTYNFTTKSPTLAH